MNPNGHAFRFHDLQIPARIKELAHHLIPGGCHTYAKGDDQYPDSGTRVHRARPGMPGLGHGRPRVHRIRHGQPRGRSRSCLPAGSGGRAAGTLPRRQLHAPLSHRGGVRRAVPGPDRRRRDGQVLQGRLRRDLRGGAAGTRLHRPRSDRLLRRPSILLRRRLVHRHDSDERRHPGDRSTADRHLPLQRPRQRRGAVRAASRAESPRFILEPARTEEPEDGYLQSAASACATPMARS